MDRRFPVASRACRAGAAPVRPECCWRIAAAFLDSFGASATVETHSWSCHADGSVFGRKRPGSGYAFETSANVYRSMHCVKASGKHLYATVHEDAYDLGMARL
jgi:hypothetical protein